MDRPSTVVGSISSTTSPRYLNETASSVARLPTASSGATRLGPITSNNMSNQLSQRHQSSSSSTTSIDNFASSSSSSEAAALGVIRPRTQLVRRGGGSGNGGEAPSSLQISNSSLNSSNGGYSGIPSSSSSSSWAQTQNSNSRLYGENRVQGGVVPQQLGGGVGYDEDTINAGGSRLVIPGLMSSGSNSLKSNDIGGSNNSSNSSSSGVYMTSGTVNVGKTGTNINTNGNNLTRPNSFYGNIPGTENLASNSSSTSTSTSIAGGRLTSMGVRGGSSTAETVTNNSSEWANVNAASYSFSDISIGSGGGGAYTSSSRNTLSSRGPTRGSGGYAEIQQQQQRTAIRLSTASNSSSNSNNSIEDGFSNSNSVMSSRGSTSYHVVSHGQRVLQGMGGGGGGTTHISDGNNISNSSGNSSSSTLLMQPAQTSRPLLTRSSSESTGVGGGSVGQLKPLSHHSNNVFGSNGESTSSGSLTHQQVQYVPPSSAYYVSSSSSSSQNQNSSALGGWPFWNSNTASNSSNLQLNNTLSTDYSTPTDGLPTQSTSRSIQRLGTAYVNTGGSLQQPSVSYGGAGGGGGGGGARPLTTLPLDQSSSSLSRTLQQSRHQQLMQQQQQQQQYSVIPPATSSGVRGANSLAVAGRTGLYQGSVIVNPSSGSVSGSFASSPYNQPVRGGFSQPSGGHSSPTTTSMNNINSNLNNGMSMPASRGGFGYNTGATLNMTNSTTGINKVSGGASLYNTTNVQSTYSGSSTTSVNNSSSSSSSGISSPHLPQQQSQQLSQRATTSGAVGMRQSDRISAPTSTTMNTTSTIPLPSSGASSSSSSAAAASMTGTPQQSFSSTSFSSVPGTSTSTTTNNLINSTQSQSLSSSSTSSSSSPSSSSSTVNKKTSSSSISNDSASTAIANATAAVAATAANAAMAAAMANGGGGRNGTSNSVTTNGVAGTSGNNSNTTNVNSAAATQSKGPNGSEDVIILPHRLVTSVAQVSAVGAVSWRGRNPTVMKINQDAVVVAEHGPTNSLLVAVFDGHGVNGREVSAYFKERYPLALFTDKRFFAKLDTKKGHSRSSSPTHSKEGSVADDDGASITSDSGPASGLYLSPNARAGKHANASPNSKKHTAVGVVVVGGGGNSNASSALCDVMADVLLSTELALIQSSGINCTLSGSTSVVVLIREGVLHIVNVGDSRGILAAAPQPTVPISSSAIAAASFAATQTGNPVPGLVPGQQMEAAAEANAQLSHPAVRIRVLTVDHKPDMPRERQRILTCGGRVLSTRVKGAPHLLGPPRVWLKNAPLPGLNMSRSLGDLIAKQAGVISTPHKAVHNISASDRALILASDGLWDFVSNEETGSLALSSSDSWDASARLARLSRSRWLTRTGGADDTTVVVVRLGEVS